MEQMMPADSERRMKSSYLKLKNMEKDGRYE